MSDTPIRPDSAHVLTPTSGMRAWQNYAYQLEAELATQKARAEELEKDYAALKEWWDLNPSLFQHRIAEAEARAEKAEAALVAGKVQCEVCGCDTPAPQSLLPGLREALEICGEHYSETYQLRQLCLPDEETRRSRLAAESARISKIEVEIRAKMEAINAKQ